FHARFAHGLSLLKRHRLRDLVGALPEYVGSLAHGLVALERGGRAPGGEATLGGVESGVDIYAGRVRDCADHLAGCGIDHVDRLAFSCGSPFSVDEELCRWVIWRRPCH